MSSTTLGMVAVMMTATFMVTAFVWQQPLQQTQALKVSESRSPSCVGNQPCHTSVTNSSTPPSKLTASPASMLAPHPPSTHTSSPYSASSSKLAPSPASILAPHSFLPNSSSSHPPSTHTSSPSSKLTASPASSSSSSLSLAPPPSPKLKHHNSDSSAATTNQASSLNSTESLSNDLSHLSDDIR
jgi:hypothetical protein